MASRARAAGWDDDGVALIEAWLHARVPDTPFLITDRRVEMQLHGEVRLVIHRFICADYDPPPSLRQCRSLLAGGGCSRPEHARCVEWLRANPTR